MHIVEVTFQFSVAAENDDEAVADAAARVIDAFPSVESPDNVTVTIEGEV